MCERRKLYRDGVLDDTNVTLDLDDLAQKGQGGAQQHSNPMQAMAAMLEVMMTRQGPRGMAGRQGGKVTMTVREAGPACAGAADGGAGLLPAC